MTYPPRSLIIAISAWVALSGLGTTQVSADQDDPPSRVGRLAYVEGAVSFQPGGTDDWVAAQINRPMTTGDQLWSDQGGRAELQLDGSSLRLSANTSVSFLNLSNSVTQIQLSSGTVLLRVRRLDDNETYEIDTPNLAFTVLRPGLYRLTVDGAGNSTAVLVRRGQGEATGGGYSYPVGQGEYNIFSGTDDLRENLQAYAPNQDAFDAWSAGRDSRWDHSVSARYVSPDVVGYEDLDDQGTWTPEPEYGNVWFPRNVETGWAPYHNGHWAYVTPWGYTWVDDSPWGFAPFHYGRWVSVGGAWGWIPAPPARPGAIYVRPVYAPALVAWVGVGAGVAWFALGPREVYCPSYRVSPGYVRNINVSNTNVNTTVINNVYNSTIINNNTVVNNTIYVNRNVAGAVAATTSQAFASAQPVGRNIVRLDDRAVASARIAALAPAAVPTKQAVLGPGRASEVRPPSAVQSRPVVARIPAPAPLPSFERRQEAIKSNGGHPLSVSQLHEVSSSTPARAPVSLAPPARLVTSGRPAPQRPDTQNQQPVGTPAPPAAQVVAPRAPAPMLNPTHPIEMPQPQRPASPALANSVLERQHLQEQQQQQAKQEADRTRLQQQQEAEHQRAAQVTADRARQQTLDQQHQVQARQSAQQQQEAERQRAAQQNTDRLRQQSIEQQRQAQTQQLAQQQQQEAERQRAAQQGAERARQQALEQQHQAQTQQLAQQHAQEQLQLQARQQEQRRQQENAPPKAKQQTQPPRTP